MQLSQEQIIENGGPNFMKGWLKAMNEGERPQFNMAGPCSLPAREKTGAGASRSTQWGFLGGEKLAVMKVFEEPNIGRGSSVVKVILEGVCESLRGQNFATMTLTLDQGMQYLDGFSDWVNKSVDAAAVTTSERAPKLKPAPKVADFRDSERWGAW